MGIKSSFITNYCTQLKFQINQENLMSHGYQKIDQNLISYPIDNNHHIEFYQQYQSKKIYALKTIKCAKKQAEFLYRALQHLQIIRNQYLCNIVYSSIQKNPFNLLSKENQVKIFTESSSLNLGNFIQKKIQEQRQLQNMIDSKTLAFSNFQIANFVHDLAGMASEIEKMCIPIHKINQNSILFMLNQGSRFKYDVNFQQILGQLKERTSIKSSIMSYLNMANKENKEKQNNTFPFQFDKNNWKIQYENKLIFELGLILIGFLLLESNDQLFNQKGKQLCKSQLQKKIEKLSNILTKQLQNKSILKQSRNSFQLESYIQRLQNNSKSSQQEQSFQLILYETIILMIFDDPNKRISVNEFKQRSKKLMQKVKQECLAFNRSKESFNMNHAKNNLPKIKDSIQVSSLQLTNSKNTILKKVNSLQEKTLTLQQNTNVSSRLKKSYSTNFSQVKNKNNQSKISSSQEQKSISSNKQNNQNQINKQKPDKNQTQKRLKKLSGIKKVQTSEHSFLEGYFQNNMAHGLAKITNRRGEVIQCIFHNNIIIQQILGPNQETNRKFI